MAEEQRKTSADVERELESAAATEKQLRNDYAAFAQQLDKQVSKGAGVKKIVETRKKLIETEKTLKFMARRLSALKSELVAAEESEWRKARKAHDEKMRAAGKIQHGEGGQWFDPPSINTEEGETIQ